MKTTTLREMAKDVFEQGVDTKGVLLFADVMLDRLQEARDEGKRNWYGCVNGALFKQLKNEIKELKKAVEKSWKGLDGFEGVDWDDKIEMTSEIKKELVDIANYCMMLYYNGVIV